MFPLPMLQTTPEDLESMEYVRSLLSGLTLTRRSSRYSVPYHLAFMKVRPHGLSIIFAMLIDTEEYYLTSSE